MIDEGVLRPTGSGAPDERPTVDASALGGAIFDCDGVILDSNRIKAQAFLEILSQEPAPSIEAFSAYRNAHPGASRNVLFEVFFRDLAPTRDWQSRASEAARAFTDRTIDALLRCPLIAGVASALEAFGGSGVPCAVVSAGALADLDAVLTQRGLKRRFVAIRGGDRSKSDHIEDLLWSGTVRRPLVYFGDSRADQEAAGQTDCRFIFVSGASEWIAGPDRDCEAIVDFTTLHIRQEAELSGRS